MESHAFTERRFIDPVLIYRVFPVRVAQRNAEH